MLTFRKPKSLVKGDTIAIVSPSGCAGALFPHRVERGLQSLRDLGFNPVVYPSVNKNFHGSAGPPEERAEDLHRAFADDRIHAIIATTGGLSLNEVLPLLDFEMIAAHPKIFCGYSDNTLLHCALTRCARMVSFYGPCLLTQFAEYPAPLSYTVDHFLTAVSTDVTQRNIQASDEWTDEILDWRQKLDLTRSRNMRQAERSHVWLHRGRATGLLTGGCLYSLLQVKGTEFDLDYEGRILLLDVPPNSDNFAKGQALSYVASQMADLKLAGVFSKIRGLLIGRAFGYTDQQHEEFRQEVLRQIAGFDFPVLCNVNIGHTDPITTVPLNVAVELDSDNNRLSILESGVS